MNEAMFVSSPEWIERPLHMRKGCLREGGREKIIGEVIGVTHVRFLLSFFSFLFPALA